MPVVNITDSQYAQLVAPPSLIDKVLQSPYILIAIVCIIIVVIYWRFGKNIKADPSTKPFWGRMVRRELLRRDTAKRMDVLGTKCNVLLEKGIAKLGIIESIEYDKMLIEKQYVDPKTKRKFWTPDYFYDIERFKFRKTGLWNWLKSLLGFGYNYIIVTPDAYNKRDVVKGRKIKIVFNINPQAHIIADSDVWTIANARAINANDEILLKAHDENIHGSDIDFLRRLAVHSPTLAGSLEKSSHDAKLKEEERKARTSPYQ